MDAPDVGTVAVLAGAIVTLVGAMAFVIRTLVKLLTRVTTEVLARISDRIGELVIEVRGLRSDLRGGLAVQLPGDEDDSDLVDEDPEPAREDDTPVHSIHAARARRAGRYGPGRPGGKEG